VDLPPSGFHHPSQTSESLDRRLIQPVLAGHETWLEGRLLPKEHIGHVVSHGFPFSLMKPYVRMSFLGPKTILRPAIGRYSITFPSSMTGTYICRGVSVLSVKCLTRSPHSSDTCTIRCWPVGGISRRAWHFPLLGLPIVNPIINACTPYISVTLVDSQTGSKDYRIQLGWCVIYVACAFGLPSIRTHMPPAVATLTWYPG
jgi:hypothetical protein